MRDIGIKISGVGVSFQESLRRTILRLGVGESAVVFVANERVISAEFSKVKALCRKKGIAEFDYSQNLVLLVDPHGEWIKRAWIITRVK